MHNVFVKRMTMHWLLVRPCYPFSNNRLVSMLTSHCGCHAGLPCWQPCKLCSCVFAVPVTAPDSWTDRQTDTLGAQLRAGMVSQAEHRAMCGDPGSTIDRLLLGWSTLCYQNKINNNTICLKYHSSCQHIIGERFSGKSVH